MSNLPPERSGGRIVVDALRLHGVDCLFGVPGESYLEILDAIIDVPLRFINCRHEGAAAHMAEAYGKLTGRPGVAIVTRGPGACHASIGLHVARQDQTPLILLVGQTPRGMLGREATQEIDIAAMFGWTTKWAGQIDDPGRIPEVLSRAFHLAVSGRPGPVAVALPEDMLRQTVAVMDTEPYGTARPSPGSADLAALRHHLGRAKQPLMVVGGGGWTAQASADLAAFAEANGLPTAADFRCQDMIDNRLSCYVGDLGIAKSPGLSRRLAEADLLLLVGSRLGDIATQGFSLVEAPNARPTLIHVFPDGDELGHVYRPDLAMVSGIPEFAKAARALEAVDSAPWHAWAEAARADYTTTLEPVICPGPLDMYAVMQTLNQALPEDAIITTDAGNFSGWPQRFHQYIRFPSQLGPRNGAMGYSVPAGIAAKVVAPERTVVSFVGDGGFQMSGLELATAVQHGLDPIVLVINNGLYGTIRMHQERRHPGRVSATELKNPDFAALGRAAGAFGASVARTEDFAPALEQALAAGRAAVLDLQLNPEAISTSTTLSALGAQARP